LVRIVKLLLYGIDTLCYYITAIELPIVIVVTDILLLAIIWLAIIVTIER